MVGIFDDYEIAAGADQFVGFRLKSGPPQNLPIDISGWLFEMSVRNAVTDELELNASVTVTDAINGTGQIHFPAVASAGKPDTDVFYDLLATDAQGQKTRLFKGKGFISAAATRP